MPLFKNTHTNQKNYLKVFLVLTVFAGLSFPALAQQAQIQSTKLSRPKLVVGIVVDQMRWDYLYRFYDRYTETGFKRLINQGFSCENTLINYLPSATAVGHSTIFTGSVPAIHGIAGNVWVDRLTGKSMYCTGDSTVQTVGSSTNAGKMSPHNLLASTITDELRIATNFKSKVVGISLKDRASILPAGHTPTAAFWLDDASGNFITSTYYMPQLPDWVNSYNAQKNIGKLISKGWNTLYPINTYTQSTADDVPWEGKFKGEAKPVFPHDIASIYQKSHGTFRRTPFGNTLTLNFASQAVDEYKLGNGASTDFLTINCASTDYVGHMFGPNSIEIEDVYLRLDKDLSAFFDHLDQKVGKGNYLVFLTADHGASNSTQFNKTNKIPADLLNTSAILSDLNKHLKKTFNIDSMVKSIATYQVYFNYEKLDQKHLNFSEVKKEAINFIRKQPGVSFAVDLDEIAGSSLPAVIKEKIMNGYNFKRSGDIQIINEPGWFSGPVTGTNHGTWNPYDVHIPLLFMGWNVKHGATNRSINMTDIAPTIAAFLHVQMPNGTIGMPITEVLNTK